MVQDKPANIDFGAPYMNNYLSKEFVHSIKQVMTEMQIQKLKTLAVFVDPKQEIEDDEMEFDTEVLNKPKKEESVEMLTKLTLKQLILIFGNENIVKSLQITRNDCFINKDYEPLQNEE